jgi:prefoldin subunit 5
MDSEGMRNWAKIKKLENERHELEKKMADMLSRLREVEAEIHKLGGI